MNKLPKVSILIPVFNRAKLILETLNSAVNQSYKNTEIIVVDNKSTDGTFEIVKKFAKTHPNVKVYQNEKNIGPVRNWKKCLEYATGEYVKILWSDDLIAPTFIEKTLPYLVNYEDVGFVFTGTEIFNDETKQRVRRYFIGNTGIYDTKKFIEGALLGGPFPLSPSNGIFRKKDVEKNLLMDIPNKLGVDFKMRAIGNDLLLYLLIANEYPKFAFINETLSFFRAHKDSISFSSYNADLPILYNIAKAYFVENYVPDVKLKKRFNAKLMLSFLWIGRKIGIKKIQDFYFTEDKISIDYLFLGKLIFIKFPVWFRSLIINKFKKKW